MTKSNSSSWTRYLIAASGTAALTASSATAAVVYWDPVDQQANRGAYFTFDMLTGAVVPSGSVTESAFQLYNSYYDRISLSDTSSLTNALVGGSKLARLSSGAMIDASADFSRIGGSFFVNYGASGYPWNTGADGTTGYVGLRFAISGNIHYGWARFTHNDVSNNVILHDFAYEDVAETAILAGATTAIPEPGSAALIAALAAGSVASYRRRRAA